MKAIVNDEYIVEIGEPELYVDHRSAKRSGHMTHAMAAFSKTEFIDFNSNCSALRWDGHSTYGWVEYRVSCDGGNTYSNVQSLPYSVQSFLDGIYTISVEKAVACDSQTVVAFCLRNDATGKTCCEPWASPMVVISTDRGATWSEPAEMCPYEGRIYDARYYKGSIYVLMLCYKHFVGVTDEHVYRVYKSDDQGKTFYEWSVLPVPGIGHCYSDLFIDDADVFHAYLYRADMHDMAPMDHIISRDGKTWEFCEPCTFAKGIRNPQVAQLNGLYLMHGRGHDMNGFVLYTSKDGLHWDEGTFLSEKRGLCFYSNNVVLTDNEGPYLLVQYSDSYLPCKVNVMHVRLRVKKQ